MFKNVVSGNPASTPWRVFGREGGSKMVPIGRMQVGGWAAGARC